LSEHAKQPSPHRAVRLAVTTLIALAAGAVPVQVRGQDSIGRARAFLERSQLPHGAFAGTPVIDTVEAMRSVAATSQREAASVALFLAHTDNNQAMFARLDALAGSPYGDPFATEVALQRIRSRSLGLAPGDVAADPLVVAQALRFAVLAPGEPGLPEGLVALLSTVASPDGGFAFADNDGELALTAEVVRAVLDAGSVAGAEALAARSLAWLTACAAGDRSGLAAADLGLLLLTLRDVDPQLVAALVNELEARQELEGGFDGGSVRSTSLAIQGLARGLPDLRVRRPSVDLAEAVSGEPLVRIVLVSNEGLVSSLPTRLDYRVVGGSGAVLFAGSAPVPSIAPGQTVSVNLDLATQGTPGEVTLEAIANPAAEFSEGEFDGNVLAFKYRVANVADLAVAVTDLTVTPDPPALHEANRVTVRVRNLGEAMARDVHVQLFAGDPVAGGVLLGQTVLNAVAAGTPRTFTAEFIPRATTAVRLVARVDPAGTVREQDETNNVAALEVTPKNPAEFTVDLRPTVSADRTSVPQGEPARLWYNVGGRVERYGNPYPWDGLWPFRGVVVAVYDGVPGAGGVEFHRERVYPFIGCNQWGCNDVWSQGYEALLPQDAPAGTHHLTVVVDPDGRIDEIDRANNVGSIDIEIVNPGIPELFVSAIDVDRHTVAEGRPSTIRAQVGNLGQALAFDVPYSVTFPTRVARGTIPLIAPGETYDVLQEVTFSDVTPSAYDVTLRVDPDGVVSESTKTNNSASVTMYQGAGDMQVDSVVQLVDPAPAGPPTPVEILVRNDSALKCWAWWLVVREPGGGIHGSVYQEVPLEAGESRLVTLDVNTRDLNAVQPMRAEVTSCAGVRDASREFVLNLGFADFAVSGPTISLEPELASSLQPIVPIVVVNNLGNIAGETSVRIYRGYPEQGDLAASGTIHVAAGASAAFTAASFVGPQQAPYVLTAVVDEEDAHEELDEWNNDAARTTLGPPGSIVVAFDEVHGPGATIGDNPDANVGGITGGLSDFARDLVARGYEAKALNPDVEFLAPAHLRGVDVLLAFAPTVPYSPSELTTLREFVEVGGGLFYLGDHRDGDYSWGVPEDQIAATFGFTSNRDFLYPGAAQCTGVFQNYYRFTGDIHEHPVTSGVDAIATQWGGSFSALPPGAEALVTAPSGWEVSPNAIFSAVFPIGEGRVGVAGDANIFDADFTAPTVCGMAALYYTGSNRRFGLQMVDWLAKRVLVDWKPDLTFNPSRLVASKQVIDAGDLVTLTTAVRNVGGALGSAGDTIVRLYDGEPAPERLLGEKAVPALEIDQGHEVVFEWDTTLAAGSHILTAVVDPDGQIDEFDEANNTRHARDRRAPGSGPPRGPLGRGRVTRRPAAGRRTRPQHRIRRGPRRIAAPGRLGGRRGADAPRRPDDAADRCAAGDDRHGPLGRRRPGGLVRCRGPGGPAARTDRCRAVYERDRAPRRPAVP
jgi:subtilase family serine protease